MLSDIGSELPGEQQDLSGKRTSRPSGVCSGKAIVGKARWFYCSDVSELLSKSRTSHNCFFVLSLVVPSLC